MTHPLDLDTYLYDDFAPKGFAAYERTVTVLPPISKVPLPCYSKRERRFRRLALCGAAFFLLAFWVGMGIVLAAANEQARIEREAV